MAHQHGLVGSGGAIGHPAARAHEGDQRAKGGDRHGGERRPAAAAPAGRARVRRAAADQAGEAPHSRASSRNIGVAPAALGEVRPRPQAKSASGRPEPTAPRPKAQRQPGGPTGGPGATLGTSVDRFRMRSSVAFDIGALLPWPRSGPPSAFRPRWIATLAAVPRSCRARSAAFSPGSRDPRCGSRGSGRGVRVRQGRP